MEVELSGGNTREGIVRIANTVRRPTGPWTPGVHALLEHLWQKGFDGAPRVHGIDADGREILDYVDGDVVHPSHERLLASDEALAEVARAIRRFHDAAASFTEHDAHVWSDRGSDPTGPTEILCHNDLAPWNLVRTGDARWVFIDWDLAAPGRRSWDLAWALLSLVPLIPDSGLDDLQTRQRVAVFIRSYGIDEFPEDDVFAVAVERCRREADLIHRLGATGEKPYARLLAEGHGEIWRAAEIHIAANCSAWY